MVVLLWSCLLHNIQLQLQKRVSAHFCQIWATTICITYKHTETQRNWQTLVITRSSDFSLPLSLSHAHIFTHTHTLSQMQSQTHSFFCRHMLTHTLQEICLTHTHTHTHTQSSVSHTQTNGRNVMDFRKGDNCKEGRQGKVEQTRKEA